MNKSFEILPPTMPNFVNFKQKAGLKQDGLKVSSSFDITDFTEEEEAEEFAELMRKTFIEHYNKRKNEKIR